MAMVEQLDPHRQMAVGHEGDEPPARLRRGRRLALVQVSGREQAPNLTVGTSDSSRTSLVSGS